MLLLFKEELTFSDKYDHAAYNRNVYNLNNKPKNENKKNNYFG